MTDDTEDKQPGNVFKFGAIKGGKEEEGDEGPAINQADYVVIDIDDIEYDVNGFLIFTPYHLAIMSDDGTGPIPALVLPISRVKTAVLADLLDHDD